MRKSCCFLIIFFHCFLHVSAQFKETDFERYTVSAGLSDNNVYCIQQDETGYIWIGTEMGLNSFNGTTFTHYFSRAKPLYLAASNILKLIPFSSNRIGVIGRLGLQVINTKNLSTENYRFPDTSFFSNYHNGINDAIELPDKSVLLSSTAGIYSFNKPGNINFRYDHYTSSDPESKRILYGRDIVVINNKEAIIYTADYKLDKYDFNEKKLYHINEHDPLWKDFYPEQTHGTNCTRIAENQFIMFNMHVDSITFYDKAKKLRVTSRCSCLRSGELNWASKVFMLSDSTFAINCPATSGYYLFILNKKTGEISGDQEKFLAGYKCNTLFLDRENRLWVGTRTGLMRQKKGSLFIHSVQLFNTNEPGFNAKFECVFRYRDKLYIGGNNRYNGLFIVDTASMKVIKKMTFYGDNNQWNEIASLQCYHKDTLWISTTKGLLWMDVNSYKYGYVTDKKGDSVLLDMEPILTSAAHGGIVWMGGIMDGKAGFYDTARRTFTFFTEKTNPSLPFGRIKHIVYDAYGDVWIAGHGLARWNTAKKCFDTTMNVYSGPNKFKDDITSITADNKGSLWLYNAENVLLEYRIKEKQFIEHGASVGLPPYVQSMADDVKDKLWFTTGSQLICYNFSTGKIVFFDQDDGLPVERASSRVITFDKERNCYYSLHNNFIATFSAAIPAAGEEKNKLLISEIAFADTVFYNPSGILKLNYTQQNFSLHFNVLNYDAPVSYHFFYSINNKKWISLDNQQVIFFNQLSYGKSSINIKAISKLGQELITQISFIVSPPFWKSWWFLLMSCIIIITTLVSFYYYRINQLLKLQKIRNNIARDLHDDIASTIASINIYSEVASEKIQQKQPAMAQEILQKMGSVSRQMIERMGDIVWSISSQNDYLLNLVERMKGFCTIAFAGRPVHVHFNVNDKFSGTTISMEKRKNIFLIFKECIHNTLKYAECKNVTITITAQKKNIIMTIEDDGKGFDADKYSAYNGNGIRNMKERAESIQGTINISSIINKGTKTELIILA